MNLKVLPVGTVLCSCSCSMGATAIVTNPLVTNQTFIGIVPGSNYSPDYLYYFFIAAADYLNSIGTGAIQTYLSRDDFRQLRLPKPPLSEQDGISRFLDRETAKIDALVAEQEQLITLLKEKRQAVISRAVTKGLDPSVPMKDSGVEWLGAVPAHWDIAPLRWAASCRSGDSLPATEVESQPDEAHTVPVIGGNGLMGYTDSPCVTHQVLAIGRVGALCGNVHIVHPPAWVTDNALVVDPDQRIFDMDFLCAALRVRNLNDLAAKTAQPLITGTQVSDQRLPKPPPSEQRRIIESLQERLAGFDDLVSEAALVISLLKERRSALISAAVTGQIDVRGLAPAPAQTA